MSVVMASSTSVRSRARSTPNVSLPPPAGPDQLPTEPRSAADLRVEFESDDVDLLVAGGERVDRNATDERADAEEDSEIAGLADRRRVAVESAASRSRIGGRS